MQSKVFLYLWASRPCMRVLTTSMGVLPKTEAAPATAPNMPTTSLLTGLLGSPPRYQSLRVSMTKKRIAWLLPCFMMVAVTPWYVPLRPSVRTISRTPWKNPLKRGLGEAWSLMNLTFTVSMGVTAKMASETPAPRPQSIRFTGDRLPRSSTLRFLSASNAPNLTADLGTDP
uniref:Uncharacterized protein n=1 Tax=Ixodes ricinus TaxID=34613 RepID=A0A6B0UYN6_IXORI